MFRFDPDYENEVLWRLDRLRSLLNLPTRSHVVDLAVRRMWDDESHRESQNAISDRQSAIRDVGDLEE